MISEAFSISISQAQKQPPKASTNLLSRLLNNEFPLLVLLKSLSAFYQSEDILAEIEAKAFQKTDCAKVRRPQIKTQKPKTRHKDPKRRRSQRAKVPEVREPGGAREPGGPESHNGTIRKDSASRDKAEQEPKTKTQPDSFENKRQSRAKDED